MAIFIVCNREIERDFCAATPSLRFLLPSFPPLFLPFLQSVQIGPALVRSEHWGCCWCAVHTPHRGWQIISQPPWSREAENRPVLLEIHICPAITGALWWGGKYLNVRPRPESVYFSGIFQPHLEGLKAAFVLPLLAVKLVLLCVISLSFCLCSSQVCCNLYFY